MAVARRTSQNVGKQYFQTKQTRKKTQNVWRDVVRPSRRNDFAIARFLVCPKILLLKPQNAKNILIFNFSTLCHLEFHLKCILIISQPSWTHNMHPHTKFQQYAVIRGSVIDAATNFPYSFSGAILYHLVRRVGQPPIPNLGRT